MPATVSSYACYYRESENKNGQGNNADSKVFLHRPGHSTPGQARSPGSHGRGGDQVILGACGGNGEVLAVHDEESGSSEARQFRRILTCLSPSLTQVFT